MQAIENWADLSGTLRALRPREGAPGMTEILIAVEEARDVDDYANLLPPRPARR